MLMHRNQSWDKNQLQEMLVFYSFYKIKHHSLPVHSCVTLITFYSHGVTFLCDGCKSLIPTCVVPYDVWMMVNELCIQGRCNIGSNVTIYQYTGLWPPVFLCCYRMTFDMLIPQIDVHHDKWMEGQWGHWIMSSVMIQYWMKISACFTESNGEYCVNEITKG